MKTVIPLVFLLVSGCEVAPEVVVVPPQPPVRAATALVFDPPVTLSDQPLTIARDTRGNAAFAGFDEPTINFTDVFTDNRQSTDGSDFVHRDSVSEKVSTLHR